jgi:hypothetical protein
MKNKDLKKTKYPGIYIDTTLGEKYKEKVIFKEKLDKANEMLKTYGVPKSAQSLVEKNS